MSVPHSHACTCTRQNLFVSPTRRARAASVWLDTLLNQRPYELTHSRNKHYSAHAWERAAPAALCRAHYFVVAYLGSECVAGAARSQSGNRCIFIAPLVLVDDQTKQPSNDLHLWSTNQRITILQPQKQERPPRARQPFHCQTVCSASKIWASAPSNAPPVQ